MATLSPAMELIIALSDAQGRVQKRIDAALSVHGISFTELTVLYHLGLAPGQMMRRIELAGAVGLSASGVTRLLVPMEKIGLVKREQNQRDTRVSLVKLTAAGGRILKDAMGSFAQRAIDVTEELNQTDIMRLLEMLKRF